MPQTGPDLVGAGYPISRPLLALLGGNTNVTQTNVPIKTNLDFCIGGLLDAQAASQSLVQTVAVPVSPGDTITKVSLLCGASQGSPSYSYASLFTGTGSAPGTTGAQPTLIAQTASTAASIPSSALYSFSFASPVTITSAQCPFGYIYASYYFVVATGSPSFVSMTAAAATQYAYFANSPVGLYFTSASATNGATLSVATVRANPPVFLLS